MAARAQTPPVNLKERIAALQQRNVSPNQHPSTQVASKGIPIAGTGTLRDKIAKFEEKGGVPVPRGNFAMGVPSPLTENAAAKKRGELYGNRIQGLGRPNGPPVSRSGSPMPLDGDAPNPRKRCISTGGTLSSPLTTFVSGDSVPPLPNSATLPAPRRNSLAVNFSLGRRAVSAGCEGSSNGLDSPSSSPLLHPSPAEEPDSVFAATVTTPLTPPSLPPETSDVLVSAEPATLSQQEEDAEESTAEEEFVSFMAEPEQSTLPDGSTPTPDVDTAPLDDKPDSDIISPDTKSNSDAIPLDCELSSSTGERSAKQGSLLDSSVVVQPADTVLQSISSTEPPTATLADSAPCSLPSATTNEQVDTVSGPEAASIPAAPTIASHSEDQPIGTAPVSTTGSNGQDAARPPSPDLKPKVTPLEKKTTFKAVVHRKVTETTTAAVPASSLAAPPIPQVPKVRRSAVTTVTNSLSNQAPGELTILLEEAALLELRLTGGDASESLDPSSLKTPTSATFQCDPRSESATTLTEQKPVSPSPDIDHFPRLSLSIPAIREPTLESEIPEIPEEDETSDGRSLASTTFSQRSPSHRKYLSSFRRLTNRRSATNMPGAYPRDSISLSSEDSAPVATPPDTGNGRNGSFGIAWPSVSPKKGVGRASSFTDKLFNRSRTRSNVSNASAAETDRSSLYETPQRSLNIPSPELSPPGRRSVQDAGSRSTTWASRDSCSELSPTSTSSFFDKDIFDAFPSVPQTLPSAPRPFFDTGDVGVGRASTLPVKGRKH
ncbi:hypothetical protein F5141DRAFT_216501 [Pisolithus sp. B1]|nr:hypothetical protein F5141DRAFT_216501 [Pisolithus sp. B1]